MTIRRARPDDRIQLIEMFLRLWPDADEAEHETEVDSYFNGPPSTTLPLEIFVAEDEAGHLCGFVQVDLRSHAEGCDARKPVTYIEGWYVAPEHRRKGVGRALIAAAEEWGASQGCLEVASDTWLDNEGSQAAHLKLGFEEAERSVHYRKDIHVSSHR